MPRDPNEMCSLQGPRPALITSERQIQGGPDAPGSATDKMTSRYRDPSGEPQIHDSMSAMTDIGYISASRDISFKEDMRYNVRYEGH
jgi:hypothetical protein